MQTIPAREFSPEWLAEYRRIVDEMMAPHRAITEALEAFLSSDAETGGLTSETGGFEYA